MLQFSLAFLALIFIPGLTSNFLVNKLFGCAAILCLLIKPGFKVKYCNVQYLFVIWLVWTFLGANLAENNSIASTGYWGRMEGFLTWALLACMAWTYWACTEKETTFELFKLPVTMRGLDLIFTCSLLVFTALITIIMFFWPVQSIAFYTNIMPDNALAGFASIGSVLLFAYTPIAAIPSILAALCSENRTVLISIFVGISSFYFLTNFKKSMKTIAIVLLVVCAVVPFTNIGHRISTLNVDVMGIGSRSQWVLQGSDLARSVPVTGYGLDTLSRYLKPAKGEYVHRDVVVDRTHFLPIDLILQTGWLGYYLVLAMLACAIHVTLKYKTKQNIICLSVIVAWIAFNCINPSGVYGHLLMLIAIFGIRKDQTINKNNQSDRGCDNTKQTCSHSSA
jgi:hypothetical protein